MDSRSWEIRDEQKLAWNVPETFSLPQFERNTLKKWKEILKITGKENIYKLKKVKCPTLIDFDTLTMVHKSINRSAPLYLSDLFVKSSTIHRHHTRAAETGLFPTHANLKFGQRSFSHYGCNLWNKLDRDAQAIENITTFKKHVKKSVVINLELTSCILFYN